MSSLSINTEARTQEIETKIRKIQLQYGTIIKNMKHQIFCEAAEFVKAQTKGITKLLTNEHHNIIEQFMRYKRNI